MTEVKNNERSRTIEEHVINTTSGPRTIPKGTREDVHPDHVTNTSRVVEEDLEYSDEEPEIIDTRGGDGWYAELEGEDGLKRIPLVAWVDLDDATMYGLIVDESTGRVSKSSVEEQPGFIRYSK